MASYELKIDLLGGEKVESILQKLSGLTGAIGSGGSSSGPRDVSDMARSFAATGKVTAKMASDMDKISSISKDIAKANKVMGGNIFGKAGGAKDFWKLNQHLLTEAASGVAASSAGKSGAGMGALAQFINQRHSSVGYAVDKDFWLSMFPPITPNKSIQQFINQRHASAGYAVDKNFWLSMFPPAITKGLRDVTGKDLAKVTGMGEINDIFHTGKMQGPDLGGIMRAKFAKKQLSDKNAFMMDMSSAMLPMFNPMSPWSTVWGAKNVFKGMNTEHGAAFRASKLGGMGAAGATALLVGAATAAGLALKGLSVVVKETIAAYENARQIYSKALQNGMGLQWSTKRSLLAQIMGVSEQEVFRFGAQMAYLNPKLEWASQILAKTATPLTAVSWEFKVLESDMSALFATIANDLAPSLKSVIVGLEGITKAAKLFYEIQRNSPSGLMLRYYEWQTKMLWKGVGAITGQKDSAMPSPQSWMKQLPAAAWEKMGLVVGGGTANYAKETAKNTRDLVVLFGKFVGGGGTTGGGGAGGQWGMSPQGNAP